MMVNELVEITNELRVTLKEAVIEHDGKGLDTLSIDKLDDVVSLLEDFREILQTVFEASAGKFETEAERKLMRWRVYN